LIGLNLDSLAMDCPLPVAVMIHIAILRIALFFLATTTGLFVGMVCLAGPEYYNYCSIASLMLGAAFSVAVFGDFRSTQYFMIVKQSLFKFKESIRPLPITIVILNGLMGFLGLVLLYKHVDFANSPDLRRVFVISGGFGIIVAQIGGWILQSFLISLISVFYGSRNGPKIFFNLVGFSYVGFLLITMVSMLVNSWVLPNEMSPIELNAAIVGSYLRVILGKVGEFIVLSIIVYGILLIENITVKKALVIAVAPSILLLMVTLLSQSL